MIKKERDKFNEDENLMEFFDQIINGIQFKQDNKNIESSLNTLKLILELKLIYDKDDNLRVGQYLENLKYEIDNYSNVDLFYLEDDKLISILEKIKHKYND